MKTILAKFVNHIYSLSKYCFGSQAYQIKLKCDPDKALNNIVSNQKNYGIHVLSTKNNITLCATEHAQGVGSKGGTSIVPVFTGKFVSRDGDVVLSGTIAIEFGIKFIMGMFCIAVYLWLPLSSIFELFGSKALGEGPLWAAPLGVIVFTGILEFGYSLYKKDAFRIKNFLDSVL
jgi:hypothetical protein